MRNILCDLKWGIKRNRYNNGEANLVINQMLDKKEAIFVLLQLTNGDYYGLITDMPFDLLSKGIKHLNLIDIERGDIELIREYIVDEGYCVILDDLLEKIGFYKRYCLFIRAVCRNRGSLKQFHIII